jgi:hypothetical protein
MNAYRKAWQALPLSPTHTPAGAPACAPAFAGSSLRDSKAPLTPQGEGLKAEPLAEFMVRGQVCRRQTGGSP